MANKQLFKTFIGKFIRSTDTVNSEKAPAYKFSDRQALAQYAATGCLNATFYANAEMQLATVLELCNAVEPEFIAKTALYAREQSMMKDMPALLAAVLSARDTEILERIFPRVISNGKMLRNYVQMVRSGQVGRKSFGSAPRRMIRTWLASRTAEQLVSASVGASPSLGDIIKMARPKPESPEREALYGWLIGRKKEFATLPKIVCDVETFRKGESEDIPDIPFQLLTSQTLTELQWREIARNAPWQTLRMNLNTFARHGVFQDAEMVEYIAGKLRNREAIRRAKVLPYQLMTAFYYADKSILPAQICDALQDAMEIATENVPAFEGKSIVICTDVSGSMQSPVTGYRKGATSVVRCVDVAALITAALLRVNRSARVLPFENNVVWADINPRDTVMTNAKKLADIRGGGTNCSAPIQLLNWHNESVDIVIMVSDNESWVDARSSGASALMQEWETLKSRNPGAKLVCIDLQPNRTTQAYSREDILNIGGFSDTVFTTIEQFITTGNSPEFWVDEIEAVEL